MNKTEIDALEAVHPRVVHLPLQRLLQGSKPFKDAEALQDWLKERAQAQTPLRFSEDQLQLLMSLDDTELDALVQQFAEELSP